MTCTMAVNFPMPEEYCSTKGACGTQCEGRPAGITRLGPGGSHATGSGPHVGLPLGGWGDRRQLLKFRRPVEPLSIPLPGRRREPTSEAVSRRQRREIDLDQSRRRWTTLSLEFEAPAGRATLFFGVRTSGLIDGTSEPSVRKLRRLVRKRNSLYQARQIGTTGKSVQRSVHPFAQKYSA
jgi:hypothetical protein